MKKSLNQFIETCKWHICDNNKAENWLTAKKQVTHTSFLMPFCFLNKSVNHWKRGNSLIFHWFFDVNWTVILSYTDSNSNTSIKYGVCGNFIKTSTTHLNPNATYSLTHKAQTRFNTVRNTLTLHLQLFCTHIKRIHSSLWFSEPYKKSCMWWSRHTQMLISDVPDCLSLEKADWIT